eukprot:jgi/Galph1/3153/GphlegSOOS_G1814.1
MEPTWKTHQEEQQPLLTTITTVKDNKHNPLYSHTKDTKQRDVGLDVFRGLCIILMILGKDQGNFDNMYSVFKHESWFSWHAADLIFPFFLFMVGASIFFALCKIVTNNSTEERNKTVKVVMSRTIKLFLVGVLLNIPLAGFHWETLRWMGILQRIAICYGSVSLLYLFGGITSQYGVIIGLFLLHTSILYGLVVPNCASYERLLRTCSAQSYLDTMILGGKHLYFHLEYDPEGILSTLMAIINTFAGLEAARASRCLNDRKRCILFWFLIGTICLSIEFIQVTFYPDIFPISKPLWTQSFLFLTIGLSFWCLAFCSFVSQWNSIFIQPCVWVGRNSFFLFAASFLLDYAALLSIHASPFSSAINMFIILVSGIPLKEWLYQHTLVYIFGDTRFASLLYAMQFTCVWILVAYILHQKRLFIKV